MLKYFSIKEFTLFEKLLWIISVTAIIVSSVISGNIKILSLIASLIGVTSLIYCAKGNVLGQILIIIFALIYGVISLEQRYYGEMITYVGMTAPIAGLTIYTWIKNPYKNTAQVKVGRLNKLSVALLLLSAIVITIIFYFILKYFNNNNLLVSTLSVTTSYLAAGLLMLRIELYALAYALNDIVLIVLWIFATGRDISALPMVVCFTMFLVNDLYGFYSWNKMKKRQIK